jgi:hypothetical protein
VVPGMAAENRYQFWSETSVEHGKAWELEWLCSAADPPIIMKKTSREKRQELKETWKLTADLLLTRAEIDELVNEG